MPACCQTQVGQQALRSLKRPAPLPAGLSPPQQIVSEYRVTAFGALDVAFGCVIDEGEGSPLAFSINSKTRPSSESVVRPVSLLVQRSSRVSAMVVR